MIGQSPVGEMFGELSIRIVLWIVLATFLCGALWYMTAQRWLLYCALGWVAVLVGLVSIDRVVVTDREQLRRDVRRMAAAVQANDAAALIPFVSDRRADIQHRVVRELQRSTFRTCRLVAEHAIVFDYQMDPPRAQMDINVYADVQATASYGYDGSGTGGVVLTFEKEPKVGWRLVDYEVYNPRQR